MMKSRQKILKSLLCFAAFFCAYIPTVNADIVFKGDTATGNIVLRYEANKHWNDAPPHFYWGERGGRHHDRHLRNDRQPRADYQKHNDRRSNNWNRRDHDRFDYRKQKDRGSRDRRW